MTQPQMIATLKQTISLMTPPGAWTQEALARDSQRNGVSRDSNQAVSYCIVGAINRAKTMVEAQLGYEANVTQPLYEELSKTQREESDEPSLANWNNDPNRTQADIQRVLKQTLERLSEEE